jgi:hypothetical protein
MIGLIKRARRRRILTRRAIPDPLWRDTVAEIESLAALDAAALERLREFALVFLHEKSIEPAGGLALDDAMRLRIAVLACRPVLELGLDCYDGFVSIVVHPGEYLVRGREHEDETGVVHVGDEVLSGESWDRGPIVLSWDDVLASGRGDGFDVVVHEFAHKLDLLDGAVNGVPALHEDMSRATWVEVMQQSFDELEAAIDRGEEPWLDPYAAENPGEFFAVCSETFFDVPAELATQHPDVYAQLSAFYRQDPLAGGKGSAALV